jgi:hypothetical protein
MHENYEDIKSRIDEKPKWYDQNGTPRYEEFHPKYCPNIYSNQVILMLVECQDCGEKFEVEIHASIWGERSSTPPRKWHYGDPPAHGCVGDTMNCVDLEVWERDMRREPNGDWEQRPLLEGDVD